MGTLLTTAKGTYQQYITSPANYTSRIPEGVSDFIAGPVSSSSPLIVTRSYDPLLPIQIMCSASTMNRALVDSSLKAG